MKISKLGLTQYYSIWFTMHSGSMLGRFQASNSETSPKIPLDVTFNCIDMVAVIGFVRSPFLMAEGLVKALGDEGV